MIRAFLVDDEPLALKRLARLLDQTGRVSVIGQATDPADALEQMKSAPFDVLFTDIEMPGLSGFEMLGRMEHPTLVIFTTAYSEHALRAFDVNSIDYLLKPIDEKQLERALTKLDRIHSGAESQPKIDTLLSQLMATLPAVKSYPARLPSKLGDKIEFVEVAKVTHFYANEKLTYAATAKKHYVVDRTIAELEEMLDPSRFVRIHRSTLVNLEFVQELHSWFAERLMIRLNDGQNTELTVARDRARLLKEKLGLKG